MKRIKDFFTNIKYPAIWTFGYITAIWAILIFMFNFNIFSSRHWALLSHARLQSFAGFVFIILILAAVPMYLATTLIIIRTKKPLFAFNPIKFLKLLIPEYVPASPTNVLPAPNDDSTTKNDISTESTRPEPQSFPNNMPSEVRQAFIKARARINSTNKIPSNVYTAESHQDTFDIPDSSTVLEPEPVQDKSISDIGNIPLPTDFDFTPSSAEENETQETFIPSFKPINFETESKTDFDFDDLGDVSDDDSSDTSDTFAPTAQSDEACEAIFSYLNAHNKRATIQGDTVITNELIIKTHSDTDFWIADPEFWFAAGHQKPSPIIELIKESAQTHRRPILYLACTNIMDLENKVNEWGKMGITVISDPTQLPV